MMGNRQVVRHPAMAGHPGVLNYKEDFRTRREALGRERYLKLLKGGNEFKKIIGT